MSDSVKVNFKDTTSYQSILFLRFFGSDLINNQLENGDEIYLDIYEKDFDITNDETTKYLKAKKSLYLNIYKYLVWLSQRNNFL